MNTPAAAVSTEVLSGNISSVVEKIDAAVDGEPVTHVLAACITMSIILQKPDISGDELEKAVFEVSQFIVMLLGGEKE